MNKEFDAQPARQVGGDEREQFKADHPEHGMILQYARDAAWAIGGGHYSYCPETPKAAEDFFPHTWVTQAIYSAFIDGQFYQAGETNSRMQRYGLTPKARAALAPSAVVIDSSSLINALERVRTMVGNDECANEVIGCINRTIYNYARLNRRAIPVGLLEKLSHCTDPDCCIAHARGELRALLGKEL